VRVCCIGHLSAALVLALDPTTAYANCNIRLPSSVEVLPEDGAVAPADIAYLFVEDYVFGIDLTVESDGNRYPVVDSLAKLPDYLKPGDVFEYMVIAEIKPEHVSGSSPGGESKFGPFSFTVGETRAAPVSEPTGSLQFVEGTLCGDRTPSSPSCEPDERLRHVVDDCYDTGVAWYWVLQVDTNAGAQFFEITADRFSSFYSRGCDRFDGVPMVDRPGAKVGGCERPNCVQVIPYDATMRPHPDRRRSCVTGTNRATPWKGRIGATRVKRMSATRVQ
jgi:hypothetical protein